MVPSCRGALPMRNQVGGHRDSAYREIRSLAQIDRYLVQSGM